MLSGIVANVGEDILTGWYRLKLSKWGSVCDKKLNKTGCRKWPQGFGSSFSCSGIYRHG